MDSGKSEQGEEGRAKCWKESMQMQTIQWDNRDETCHREAETKKDGTTNKKKIKPGILLYIYNSTNLQR